MFFVVCVGFHPGDVYYSRFRICLTQIHVLLITNASINAKAFWNHYHSQMAFPDSMLFITTTLCFGSRIMRETHSCSVSVKVSTADTLVHLLAWPVQVLATATSTFWVRIICIPRFKEREKTSKLTVSNLSVTRKELLEVYTAGEMKGIVCVLNVIWKHVAFLTSEQTDWFVQHCIARLWRWHRCWLWKEKKTEKAMISN